MDGRRPPRGDSRYGADGPRRRSREASRRDQTRAACRTVGVLATVLGSSIAMLDATVVNVALPTIGPHLHASLGDLQWTVNAYTLRWPG